MSETIESFLKPMIHEKAEALLDEEIARHPELIHQRKQLLKSKEKAVSKELVKGTQEVLDDIGVAFEAIQHKMELLPLEEREKLQAEFKQAADISANQDIEFSEHTPLQQTFKLSNQALSFIYTVGYEKQQQDDYKSARAIARFLILLNPIVMDFWVLLGFSLTKLENFEEAQQALNAAIALNPTHPQGPYFALICALDQKHIEEARHYYEQGMSLVKDHPDQARWQELFAQLKDSIEVK